MVKSEQIFSPQNYLEAVTGNCYFCNADDDLGFIDNILAQEGFELWDYPLSEINHIVENNINVVLVDCMVTNPETDQFEHVYRWFEVPENFSVQDE